MILVLKNRNKRFLDASEHSWQASCGRQDSWVQGQGSVVGLRVLAPEADPAMKAGSVIPFCFVVTGARASAEGEGISKKMLLKFSLKCCTIGMFLSLAKEEIVWLSFLFIKKGKCSTKAF